MIGSKTIRLAVVSALFLSTVPHDVLADDPFNQKLEQPSRVPVVGKTVLGTVVGALGFFPSILLGGATISATKYAGVDSKKAMLAGIGTTAAGTSASVIWFTSRYYRAAQSRYDAQQALAEKLGDKTFMQLIDRSADRKNRKENIDLLRAWLKFNPLLVVAKDANGQTALHRAIASGNRAAVGALFDAGADVNAPDKDGRTPILIAGEKNDYAMVDFIRGYKAKHVEKTGKREVTVEDSTTKTPKTFLIEHIAHQIHNPVLLSVKDKKGRGLPSDAKLREARCERLVQAFAKQRHVKGTTRQLEQEGYTRLHVAASLGDLTNVNHFLDENDRINARDRSGRTPILVAAQAGNVQMVRHLASLGAKVDVKDFNGMGLVEHGLRRFKKTTGKSWNQLQYDYQVCALHREQTLEYMRAHHSTEHHARFLQQQLEAAAEKISYDAAWQQWEKDADKYIKHQDKSKKTPAVPLPAPYQQQQSRPALTESAPARLQSQQPFAAIREFHRSAQSPHSPRLGASSPTLRVDVKHV